MPSQLVFLGTPVEELRGVCKIETQEAFQTGAPNPTVVYPDITIRGHYKTGKGFLVIIENKWDSNTNTDQLETYRRLEQGSRLVFVSPNAAQNGLARPSCDCVFRWDEVFKVLAPFGSKDQNVASFLEFLSEQSLGPQERLSLGRIAAYVHALRVPPCCYALANHLTSGAWPWDFLPAGLGAVEHRHPQQFNYGRTGIEFFFEVKRPGIFAGFLLDAETHQLKWLDPIKGIEMILVIESDPRTRISGDAISLAAHRIPMLAGTEASDQDHLRHKWLKLVVRTPLADVIAAKNTEEQQALAIYERFAEWGRILFADGTLESAFRDTWPEAVPWKVPPADVIKT